MQFILVHGDDDGPSWLVPVVALVIVLSPVVLGLPLRLWDRRAGAEAIPPARPRARRKGLGVEFTLGLIVAYGVLFLLVLVGLGVVALPLAFVCLVATRLRQGYGARS